MSKDECFAESLKWKYLIEAIAISGICASWSNYRDTTTGKAVCVALALVDAIFFLECIVLNS